MNVVLAKKFQEPVELSDAHPFDQINMLREDRIGFAGECSRNYFLYASFPRSVSKQPRIHPVSGDDSEDIWGALGVILSGAESKNPEYYVPGSARDPSTSLGMTGAHLKIDRSLPVAAALDVQLGERFLQRRLNCRYFL